MMTVTAIQGLCVIIILALINHTLLNIYDEIKRK